MERASCFLRAAAHWLSATRGFVLFKLLSGLYKGTKSSLRSTTVPRATGKASLPSKKLAETAKVPTEAAKQWFFKQALWQIYLPAPRYVIRPNFDVRHTSRSTKEAFFFCPTTSFLTAAKFTNTLAVVDVDSLYKETEPLTLKDSAKVAN